MPGMKTANRTRMLKGFDLQEIAIGNSSMRVDADQHVIRSVKLLGLESVNKATYTDAALSLDFGLYEGADCFIDHPGSPTSPRGYGDKFGKIRGVKHVKGKGLYGDIHYNPMHTLVEQVKWDAANSPESIGMSPNHRVQAVEQANGHKIVQRIAKVRSVDIVSNPATTLSLFEHEEDMKKPTLRQLLKRATPYGRQFSDRLENDEGVDVTAPIDVLGDMKPAEAVADALAQTAVAIFMDDTVSPEETGSKITELATIVAEVKARVEPGGLKDADPEEVADGIEDIEDIVDAPADGEAPADEAPVGDAPADDAHADEAPAEDAPADESAPVELPTEDDEDEDKVEAIVERKLNKLVGVVNKLVKRDTARGVLESANAPVTSANLSELMECADQSKMRDVMESWSGQRRNAPRPVIKANVTKPVTIPDSYLERKARYISK